MTDATGTSGADHPYYPMQDQMDAYDAGRAGSNRVAVARAIFEACRSYIVGDRKDIGYDDLYGNEQSDLLDAADAVLHAIPNSEANDDWHTDEDKAWEAEMNDPDRGLVDAFGVKPDFVVDSPDAVYLMGESVTGQKIPDTPLHATRNSAAGDDTPDYSSATDHGRDEGEWAVSPDATRNRGAEYLSGYRDGYFEARRVAIKALDRGHDE